MFARGSFLCHKHTMTMTHEGIIPPTDPVTHPEEQNIIEQFYTDRFLGKLHQDFLQYAAAHLDAMPRPRFGQLDTLPAFSHRDFVARFGIDTSHRLHPIKQHYVLSKLLYHEHAHLDPDQLMSLELTAVVHDMGEPFSKEGDAVFGTRVDLDEETAARHSVIREIAPTRAEEIIERTEPNLKNHESEGGRIFYISELIGYCLTGQRIAIEYLKARKTQDLTDDQMFVAGTIITSILNRSLPVLGEVADESSYAKSVYTNAQTDMNLAAEAFSEDFSD